MGNPLTNSEEKLPAQEGFFCENESALDDQDTVPTPLTPSLPDTSQRQRPTCDDGGIPMTFLNNKHDLHLKANLETPGWMFLGTSELVISYESVQRNRDGNVMFSLQAIPELKRAVAIISHSIHVSQEGKDAPTYRIAEELPVGQSEMRSKPGRIKDTGHTSNRRRDHKGACNCETPSQAFQNSKDPERDSPPSDKKAFLGGSFPSNTSASTNPESSESDSSPSDKKLFLGGSIPSDKLYDSSTSPESSERDSSPSDKLYEFSTSPESSERDSSPSDKLYDSSTNPESSERDSSPSLNSYRYGPSGESDHSHDSCQDATEPKQLLTHESYQDATEPKQLVQAEIEIVADLALDITGSDNDEPGSVEVEEVNGSGTASSVMTQDDQESTTVTIVTIPEVEHFPEVYFETTV
ncbi:hypothetical protein Bbelb_385550 [Branchiostoma belcheri]|nr:hypothetical protein Bbelb_385550 [Branchiostoma belcheri]